MTVGSSETLTRKGRNGRGSQDLERPPRQPSTLPRRAPTDWIMPAPRLVRCSCGVVVSQLRADVAGVSASRTIGGEAAVGASWVFVVLFLPGCAPACTVEPAAGRRGTTAARHEELGANTPARRSNGKRGGGIR